MCCLLLEACLHILLLCILLLMYMWDCQKEIQVFIVLFRMRLFYLYWNIWESRYQHNFSSRVELGALCAIHQCYMGLLSKLCWWWPIYLAVGDGQKPGGCGENAVLKHKPHIFVYALGWGDWFLLLNGPLTSAVERGSVVPSLWLCVKKGRVWDDEWASFYLYIHCRGRLL